MMTEISNDVRYLLGIPPIEAKKTAIYKHKNKDGEIIYVGVSDSAHNRSAQHLSTSKWREEIATIDVEWVPNRLIAEVKEIQYIKELRPRYNKAHNNKRDVSVAVHQRLESFLEEKKKENTQELANFFGTQDWVFSLEERIDALKRKRNTVENREKISKLEKELDEALSCLDGLEDREDIDALLCERAMMYGAPKDYVLSFLVAGAE